MYVLHCTYIHELYDLTALSPPLAAAALLALKRAATNAKFGSWAGSDPCGATPWQYITCTQGRVIAL